MLRLGIESDLYFEAQICNKIPTRPTISAVSRETVKEMSLSFMSSGREKQAVFQFPVLTFRITSSPCEGGVLAAI